MLACVNSTMLNATLMVCLMQASWSRMNTNRTMSRGATGDFGSRSGTQNFSEGGSTFASDSSRTSTVSHLPGSCGCLAGQGQSTASHLCIHLRSCKPINCQHCTIVPYRLLCCNPPSCQAAFVHRDSVCTNACLLQAVQLVLAGP